MDMLWSLSTTLRNPERIPGFFFTISELDGFEWNHETQMKLQALLIKNRLYKPTPSNLNSKQVKILDDPLQEMTYETAREIFDSKNYMDPPMRGRTSFDPVEKMGLVHIVNGRIKVSELGLKYINGDIDFGEVILNSFLKLQYPNPLTPGFDGYNTKPFINTLRLINLVNTKCLNLGMVAKGISREELGIFALSLKRYIDVELVADRLIDFRIAKDNISDYDGKRRFTESYILDYLSTFQKPISNVYEYSDNMIRCLRLTKFIFIRGGGYYIDLEPRRMVEIQSLLAYDNGSSRTFSEHEWIEYMADYSSYKVPWEETNKLIEIKKQIIDEVNLIESELNYPITRFNFDESNPLMIKEEIEEYRGYRTILQTEFLKYEYQDINKIDNTILELINIRDLGSKPSIELERLANLSLNIIDDALKIKPNYPVGDDNQPIFTAPAKVPDIECYYETFNSICEVTMLTGRDQWYNEGQPVMRHLRDFERRNEDKIAYCLFVAPSIHIDTLNTFWTSVKYEYEGNKQKIIPITINQLIMILKSVKELREKNKKISHIEYKSFLDQCTDLSDVASSIQWKEKISHHIEVFNSTLE